MCYGCASRPPHSFTVNPYTANAPHTNYTPARRAQHTLGHVGEGVTVTLPIGGAVKVIKQDKRADLTVVEGANGRTLRLSAQTRVELGRE